MANKTILYLSDEAAGVLDRRKNALFATGRFRTTHDLQNRVADEALLTLDRISRGALTPREIDPDAGDGQQPDADLNTKSYGVDRTGQVLVTNEFQSILSSLRDEAGQLRTDIRELTALIKELLSRAESGFTTKSKRSTGKGSIHQKGKKGDVEHLRETVEGGIRVNKQGEKGDTRRPPDSVRSG